jgi:negative regulator of flagellin synthesis FlgM
MTNTISPFSQTPLLADSAGTSPAKPASSVPADSAADTSQSEAVTLSAAAQTTTQLLGAAQDSDGINQEAVAQIRSALQAGTYNVAPEDLAQAIVTVLKESN